MSIMSRIKKRLPVVGGGAAPTPRPPTPGGAASPTWDEDPEPESARGQQPVTEFIDEFVKSNKIAIFMKGSPTMPQCGFSANAAAILRSYDKPLASFDVLSDPDVRQGVKDYSQWPTIPQVYINGEFLGGSDILMQMHQSGELKQLIDEAFAG